MAVALLLRLNGYAETPAATDNADEWAWAWAGLTLLTKGVPTAWSYLNAYPVHTVLRLHGTGYPMVSPWLDHPPLFALVVGLFQLLFGQHSIPESTTAAIRLPALLLGSGSIGLVQAVGRRLVGPGAALTGAALLAVAPAPVLLSREVESEALLAPLILLAILLVHRLRTGEGGLPALAALGVVAAAAVLTKVPGLAVGVAAAAVLLAGRQWAAAAVAVGGAAAGIAVYALYGAHYDWQLFLSVLNAQSARRSGVMGAFEFIAAPAGINGRLRDGWWLLGWLAIGALAAGRPSPRQWLLAWPVLVYALAILALADEHVVARYGWYHIAVYPLVYLAAGWLVWRAVTRPQVAAVALVLALGGAAATSLALGQPWMPPAWLVIAAVAAFLLPPLIAPRRYARVTTAVLLAALLVAGVAESYDLAAIQGLF